MPCINQMNNDETQQMGRNSYLYNEIIAPEYFPNADIAQEWASSWIRGYKEAAQAANDDETCQPPMRGKQARQVIERILDSGTPAEQLRDLIIISRNPYLDQRIWCMDTTLMPKTGELCVFLTVVGVDFGYWDSGSIITEFISTPIGWSLIECTKWKRCP